MISNDKFFFSVPLVLSEITRLDYFHVGNGIELDEMVGKHKIERYISCLIKRSYPELIERDNPAAIYQLVVMGLISIALILLYKHSTKSKAA